MSWTPGTSISSRAAHPSRTRVPSEQLSRAKPRDPESTDPSQSHRKRPDPSPRSVGPFSRRSTPLSHLFSTFAHSLLADRRHARTLSRSEKWAYSAQFWCNISPLDATLPRALLCVANKELAECLSPLAATFTKNIGGHSPLPYLLSRPGTLQSSLPPPPSGGALSGVN